MPCQSRPHEQLRSGHLSHLCADTPTVGSARRALPLSEATGAAEASPDAQRIFVSIASFRDSECQHTLRDLFSTALWPCRVFVGLVGQYDAVEDGHCFSEAPFPACW